VKTVLIIGGSGFVGSHLATRLRGGYRVVTTHFRHPQRIQGVTDYPLSVSQLDWMKELVFNVQPEIVIYAGGRQDLQWTENPAHSKAVDLAHVAGPTNLLAASQLLGSRFIYLSSALVFDGARGNYRESDIVIPGTVLGKAKVAAENQIRNRALNFLMLRSAPLLGRGPAQNPSMLDHWLHRWGHGQSVELDDRTRHSYATVEDFVEWVARCLESSIKNRTLHFGGLTRCTEHEVGLKLARRLGVPATLVVRKPSDPNADPLDYSLNTTASVKGLEIQPLFLQQSLDLIQERLLVP
jgi:dTDP-4-dehydrorhamnose reductase